MLRNTTTMTTKAVAKKSTTTRKTAKAIKNREDNRRGSWMVTFAPQSLRARYRHIVDRVENRVDTTHQKSP